MNYAPTPDLVKMAKSSVEDYLSYPESASFKGVKYNFIRQTADKGDLGYVCGEVFRVKNAKLEGYKNLLWKRIPIMMVESQCLFQWLKGTMTYYRWRW
nr:hypothetical protein [Providencia sp. G1(2023)]